MIKTWRRASSAGTKNTPLQKDKPAGKWRAGAPPKAGTGGRANLPAGRQEFLPQPPSFLPARARYRWFS